MADNYAFQHPANDTEAIDDPRSPAGIVMHMYSAKVYSHTTENGKLFVMCEGMPELFYRHLVQYVKDQESWHGHWFLWKEIKFESAAGLRRALVVKAPEDDLPMRITPFDD